MRNMKRKIKAKKTKLNSLNELLKIAEARKDAPDNRAIRRLRKHERLS